jgi:hypothetical protein
MLSQMTRVTDMMATWRPPASPTANPELNVARVYTPPASVATNPELNAARNYVPRVAAPPAGSTVPRQPANPYLEYASQFGGGQNEADDLRRERRNPPPPPTNQRRRRRREPDASRVTHTGTPRVQPPRPRTPQRGETEFDY